MAISLLQFGLVVLLLATLPLWGRAASRPSDAVTAPSAAEGVEGVEGGETDGKEGATVRPWRIPGVAYAPATFLFCCGVEAGVGLWGSSILVSRKGLAAADAAQ
jgi:hypothetical protein